MNQDWRIRYGLIFLGQGLSQIGSAITQFVLLWWITETTGDISSLATAGMAALLPQAVLGPIGGVVADRYSRKLIMIATDAVSAICMVIVSILFYTNSAELWQVYVLMALRSCMQAFQGPASQASIIMLVPKDFIGTAAGLNQGIISLMTIAAAPLGALAITIFGTHNALLIDVGTAILAIATLLVYKLPQPPKASLETSPLTEFREGLSLVWNNKVIRHIFYINAGVILIIVPCFTLVPMLVTSHFQGTVKDVGLIEGLAGVGMLLGSLLASYLNVKRRAFFFITSLATSCFCIGLTALSPQDSFVLAVVFWFLSGITYTFGSAPMMAILQTSVPSNIQGRVFSLMNTVAGIFAPIGLAFLGTAGELLGVRMLFVVCGLASGLFALLGLLSKELFASETTHSNVA